MHWILTTSFWRGKFCYFFNTQRRCCFCFALVFTEFVNHLRKTKCFRIPEQLTLWWISPHCIFSSVSKFVDYLIQTLWMIIWYKLCGFMICICILIYIASMNRFPLHHKPYVWQVKEMSKSPGLIGGLDLYWDGLVQPTEFFSLVVF